LEQVAIKKLLFSKGYKIPTPLITLRLRMVEPEAGRAVSRALPFRAFHKLTAEKLLPKAG
jgi:hypothetical protein